MIIIVGKKIKIILLIQKSSILMVALKILRVIKIFFLNKIIKLEFLFEKSFKN